MPQVNEFSWTLNNFLFFFLISIFLLNFNFLGNFSVNPRVCLATFFCYSEF